MSDAASTIPKSLQGRVKLSPGTHGMFEQYCMTDTVGLDDEGSITKSSEITVNDIHDTHYCTIAAPSISSEGGRALLYHESGSLFEKYYESNQTNHPMDPDVKDDNEAPKPESIVHSYSVIERMEIESLAQVLFKTSFAYSLWDVKRASRLRKKLHKKTFTLLDPHQRSARKASFPSMILVQYKRVVIQSIEPTPWMKEAIYYATRRKSKQKNIIQDGDNDDNRENHESGFMDNFMTKKDTTALSTLILAVLMHTGVNPQEIMPGLRLSGTKISLTGNHYGERLSGLVFRLEKQGSDLIIACGNFETTMRDFSATLGLNQRSKPMRRHNLA